METIVKQVDDNEIPAEVLATAIECISSSLQQWRAAGMRRSALVVLLAASTRVRKGDIVAVLDGIDSLRKTYCLPKPEPTVESKDEVPA